MTGLLGSCSALVAALALARPADATTLYVSPTATAETGCTTRANPCSLASAAAAVVGDTVVLMDGLYKLQPRLPRISNRSTARNRSRLSERWRSAPQPCGAGAGAGVTGTVDLMSLVA